VWALPKEVLKLYYKVGTVSQRAVILFKPTLVWGAEVSHKPLEKKMLSVIESSFFADGMRDQFEQLGF
jgi:hypothetical protein